MAQLPAGQGTHMRVDECSLAIADWSWPLAQRHDAEIALAWQRRQAEAGGFFDGPVYLFKDYVIDAGRLVGTMFRTDFKTLLYFRALPFAASDSVREASGASLIRSAEGHLLFGRQAPGQLNSGRIYPPSGVIDADDVAGDRIDIEASIVRELGEETGLLPADFERVPGYVLALVGVHVAIGVEWRSQLPAVELRERILDFLRPQASPELEDIVIVRSEAQLADQKAPPHARVFARALIGADCP